MTKEETIQVLKSIEDRAVDFPNMTACDWAAIAAAKKYLSNYIDKNTLVAEIEKRRSKNSKNKLNLSAAFEDNYLLSFINTIGAKKVVAEQEGICNGILNTIIGDTWHMKLPLDKVGLQHKDKVTMFITKEE